MQGTGTYRIIVVSMARSYLVTSLIEQINSKGNEAVWAQAEVNSLHEAMDGTEAVLINVSEELVNDSSALIFIRDKSIESNLPVFLYGEAEQLGRAEKIFGGQVAKAIFTRPIDVHNVVEGIDSVMENYQSGVRKKVLVVDDSGAMLRNVKGWLEDKYQVILANSGAMAIKYLSTDRPDLVLLDYEMPIIDGRQVLEMIRSETEFQDVPVIFLTGKDDRDSIIRVMSLRPEGYLLKTLPPEQIIKAVDDFFEKQKKL